MWIDPDFERLVSLQVTQREGAASQQMERPHYRGFLFPQLLKLHILPNLTVDAGKAVMLVLLSPPPPGWQDLEVLKR